MTESVLVLVRHGQSEWNAKNLLTGWKDPDLTQVGIDEAVSAAADDAIADFILGDVGKSSSSGRPVVETVSRENLVAVQTPQVFDAALLRAAYATAELAGTTDDASVLERAGHQVLVVEGDPRNLKITSQDDLALARAILTVAPPAGPAVRF